MPADPDRTETETVDAEESAARRAHVADRPPTAEEERAAETAAEDVDSGVADHYSEMAERGAHVRGEGQIEP